MTDDERAIRNAVDTWLAASKTGDTATVLSLMTDDALFMTPGQPSRRNSVGSVHEAHGDQRASCAADIDVSPSRISEIVNGARPIIADTALRLGLSFNMEPRCWMNLRAAYDMRWGSANCRTASRRAFARFNQPRSETPALKPPPATQSYP